MPVVVFSEVLDISNQRWAFLSFFIIHTYIVLMSKKLDVEGFIHVRHISPKEIRKSSMMTY